MECYITNWDKVNQETKKVNESLTAKLERYKERVKTLEQRFNVDLNSREKLNDSQMDNLIRNRSGKRSIRRIERLRYGILGFLGAQIRRIFLDGYDVLVVRTVKLQNANIARKLKEEFRKWRSRFKFRFLSRTNTHSNMATTRKMRDPTGIWKPMIVLCMVSVDVDVDLVATGRSYRCTDLGGHDVSSLSKLQHLKSSINKWRSDIQGVESAATAKLRGKLDALDNKAEVGPLTPTDATARAIGIGPRSCELLTNPWLKVFG
ncbi:hypothetical protein Tco_0145011 [Tanacetum coccineum]